MRQRKRIRHYLLAPFRWLAQACRDSEFWSGIIEAVGLLLFRH